MFHLRQEIDGPQAEQPEFVPCGQILQDEEEEELSPAQISDQIFLTLEVKENFLTTHAQKSSWRSKGRGYYPIVSDIKLPTGFFARIHLG